MLELYTWTTNNGRKPIVCLEEMGLDYEIHWLDIWRGETRTPEYANIHPVGMIPALVDSDGPGGESVTVWESIVILIYLAEKTAMFLPTDAKRRIEVLEWTLFHGASAAPIFDQFIHFARDETGETPAAIIDMVNKKSERRLAVYDRCLAGRDYLCDEFSIADVANYPLMVVVSRLGMSFERYANLSAWFERMGARPGVSRGMTIAPEGEEAVPTARGRGSPTIWPVG